MFNHFGEWIVRLSRIIVIFIWNIVLQVVDLPDLTNGLGKYTNYFVHFKCNNKYLSLVTQTFEEEFYVLSYLVMILCSADIAVKVEDQTL